MASAITMTWPDRTRAVSSHQAVTQSSIVVVRVRMAAKLGPLGNARNRLRVVRPASRGVGPAGLAGAERDIDFDDSPRATEVDDDGLRPAPRAHCRARPGRSGTPAPP